ncbi:MAG: anthranilate phosphoribosyltransferase [Demequinaceae bacterium]|nr:anthranilate phosphoribosyltransferase [Demequinaceae bacterium]
MPTWTDVLGRLMGRNDLTKEDTAWVMDRVLADEAPPVAIAAFLAAIRTKGETIDEVSGLAEAMLGHANRIEVPGRAVDVVGTGGDGRHTVNISTMASIVVAGTGTTVVKHGNRAASSKCGAADMLAVLGLDLDLPPARVEEIAKEVGITFCFAQVFHPSMRFAGPIRKELGVPTTFNILGPLTNPAQPTSSAIGSASLVLAPVIAGVLANQGREGIVFRGTDGLDELAGTSSADVWEVRGGAVTAATLDPVRDLGLAPITIEDLRGGEAEENAAIARRILAGEKGPVRDTVVLNAAAGLVADGIMVGTDSGSLAERFQAGMGHAAAAIDSGEAAGVLERWIAASAQ